MAIANSSLNVDVWNEIRSTLVASAIYVTNSQTSETIGASIAASYNDKNLARPQIIIAPIAKDETLNKFGSNYGKQLISVSIECYADKSVFVDQLADKVEESLRGATIPGISLIAIGSDISFVNPNEAKYHLKSLTFTYDRE